MNELLPRSSNQNELNQMIRADTIDLLYRQLINSQFFSVLVAAIVAAIFWNKIGHTPLILWLLIIILIAIARLFLRAWRRRRPPVTEWQLLFAIALIILESVQLEKEHAINLNTDLASEIEAHKATMKRLDQMAHHDALTSLPNRALFATLLELIDQPFHVNGDDFQIGVSIGLSLFPADGDDMMSLLKHADVAMYRAKGKGENNFQFYS